MPDLPDAYPVDAADAVVPNRSRCYAVAKRTLDITVAAAALVLLWPVLLALAIAIRLTSPGPALFRQQRAGRDGRPFTLYKFRTMRTDADPYGDSPKSGDDPRLTRIGRFLRETSLDELPQLWNVLIGDMSLVGPRPLYVAQITEWTPTQRQRLLVKPGLTGLAQITGRGGLTVEEKLDLDVEYVRRQGFGYDLRLLAATVRTVFSRRDIYEVRYSRERLSRSGSNGPSSSADSTPAPPDGPSADSSGSTVPPLSGDPAPSVDPPPPGDSSGPVDT